MVQTFFEQLRYLRRYSGGESRPAVLWWSPWEDNHHARTRFVIVRVEP